MGSKQRLVAISFVVVSLLVGSMAISSCGPGQLLGPTFTPTPTPIPGPRAGLWEGKEGSAEVSFTVTQDGQVQDFAWSDFAVQSQARSDGGSSTCAYDMAVPIDDMRFRYIGSKSTKDQGVVIINVTGVFESETTASGTYEAT